MPTEDCKMKQLEAENEKLKRELSEIKDKEYKKSVENSRLEREISKLEREKDRLLEIIENLSKGFANMESVTKK